MPKNSVETTTTTAMGKNIKHCSKNIFGLNWKEFKSKH